MLTKSVSVKTAFRISGKLDPFINKIMLIQNRNDWLFCLLLTSFAGLYN